MGTDLYTQPGIEPNFNWLRPSSMVPTIIGLSGYARSGKDTVAGIIHRLYGHQVLSYSDILREFLYGQGLSLSYGCYLNEVVDEFGWDEARSLYPEIRELQQKTGTEAGRDILGPRVWVDAWERRVLAQGGMWVNPSIRFPNELDAIQYLGGVVLRVRRPGVEAVNGHSSDSALDGYVLDVIENDGTLTDLEGEVQRVLGEFV